jgi:hypothetical protein
VEEEIVFIITFDGLGCLEDMVFPLFGPSLLKKDIKK